MPKLIENLPSRLTDEADRQLRAVGYGAMTIRSVAKACGVGVGTVYNYYASKDELVAACVLKDWTRCVAAIREAGASAGTPEPVLRCIYDQLRAFTAEHASLFHDKRAAAVYAGSFGRYHALLRAQLAEALRRFCGAFTAEFAAEALLTWTVAGRDFTELYSELQKLF